MKEFDAIIIGGGAAGCFCALSAPKNKKVLLIEKGPSPAKKILVTGNGRCNLTNNTVFPSQKYYNQNIDKFIKKCPPQKILDIFENLGLVCYSDNAGRVYPLSNSAKSVVDVITNALLMQKNLEIISNIQVDKVNYENNKYMVFCNNEIFLSEKLVVATGGKGINYFNVKSKTPQPSLVALKGENTKFLEGIRINPVKISTIINNVKYEDEGEILFKDSGISGIVTFNISSYFARNGKFEGEIFLDLYPSKNQQEIFERLSKRKNLLLPINKMFDGLFLPQIGYLILNKCHIDENRLTNMLSNKELEKIAKIIKCMPLKIKSHYDNQQVYSGGILLDELNDCLECKKQKGLYFCGEICDVDGLCGGYNLQWAWTSGYIVGENL